MDDELREKYKKAADDVDNALIKGIKIMGAVWIAIILAIICFK